MRRETARKRESACDLDARHGAQHAAASEFLGEHAAAEPDGDAVVSTPQPNQMAMPSQPMMVSMTSDGQVMMQSLIPVLTPEGQMMMLNGNQMFPMMMSGYNVSVDRGDEA